MNGAEKVETADDVEGAEEVEGAKALEGADVEEKEEEGMQQPGQNLTKPGLKFSPPGNDAAPSFSFLTLKRQYLYARTCISIRYASYTQIKSGKF